MLRDGGRDSRRIPAMTGPRGSVRTVHCRCRRLRPSAPRRLLTSRRAAATVACASFGDPAKPARIGPTCSRASCDPCQRCSAYGRDAAGSASAAAIAQLREPAGGLMHLLRDLIERHGIQLVGEAADRRHDAADVGAPARRNFRRVARAQVRRRRFRDEVQHHCVAPTSGTVLPTPARSPSRSGAAAARPFAAAHWLARPRRRPTHMRWLHRERGLRRCSLPDAGSYCSVVSLHRADRLPASRTGAPACQAPAWAALNATRYRTDCASGAFSAALLLSYRANFGALLRRRAGIGVGGFEGDRRRRTTRAPTGTARADRAAHRYLNGAGVPEAVPSCTSRSNGARMKAEMEMLAVRLQVSARHRAHLQSR